MKFQKAAEKLYEKLERDVNLKELCRYTSWKTREQPKEDFNMNISYSRKRRVYPNLERDGRIKWFNFITGGSYWKILGVVIFVVIALGFIFENHNNFQACEEAMYKLNELELAKGINYSELSPYAKQQLSNPEFNFSEVNISKLSK